MPVFQEKDYSPEGLAQRHAKYMLGTVEGFVDAYEEILKSAGTAYRTIFQYLAGLPDSASLSSPSSSSSPTPGSGVRQGKEGAQGALIHCTAGKDRTGLFFAILFDFLQVPRSLIAEDYHLTEQGLLPVREEIVERLMGTPAFKNYLAAQRAGRALSHEEIARLVADEEAGVAEVEMTAEQRGVAREAALRMVGARKETMVGTLEMVDRVFGGSERYMREVCGLGDEELEALRRNLVEGWEGKRERL